MSTFDDFLLKLRNTSDDKDIARLVRHVSRNNLEPHEVASLATKLADSGSSLPASAKATADIPSTGGSSSLSTLVCPLFLRLKGFVVPKLAVPGRPAGGIDVLATIPGYETDLSRVEVVRCLDQCQYAHFLAGNEFVPLDARMFRIRQQLGAQDNPYLTAASLISKKLAASVNQVRLDVRVGPHGNFGRTLDDARTNARIFNSVATMVGLDSGCYLTDARFVYQPYIGRGEALVALDELFNDTTTPWLAEHLQNCWEMTETLIFSVSVPEGNAMREVFADNLAAQGSSIGEFNLRVDEVRESTKAAIRARSCGYLQIDISKLRQLLVHAQAAYASEDVPFSDPTGIELVCRPGQMVYADQPIALVRGIDALNRASSLVGFTVESIISIAPSAESSYHSFVPFDAEWVIGDDT